jgi:hypothetical protein
MRLAPYDSTRIKNSSRAMAGAGNGAQSSTKLLPISMRWNSPTARLVLLTKLAKGQHARVLQLPASAHVILEGEELGSLIP